MAMLEPIAANGLEYEERRRFQRVRVNLLGRYMLLDKREFPCQVIEMSPGDMVLIAPQIAKEGERIIAYIDHLRGLHRFERLVGLIIILIGVAIVVTSTYTPLPKMAVLLAYAMLAAGWVVFFYVILKRTAWRKANPFETWSP